MNEAFQPNRRRRAHFMAAFGLSLSAMACGGGSLADQCEVELAFEHMTQVLSKEEFPLHASAFHVAYQGTYSPSCQTMLANTSGEYLFRLSILARPSPASVATVQLASGRVLRWAVEEKITLQDGNIQYERPIVYGRREDRNLLLPWVPAPDAVVIHLEYPLEPTLDSLPTTMNIIIHSE